MWRLLEKPILLEGPQANDTRRLVAQHIVARGLESVPHLPQHLTLRFRVVSVWVPAQAAELTPDVSVDDEILLQKLHAANEQRGFRVIGVSIDAYGEEDRVRRFAADFGATFPIWLDPDERVAFQFRAIGRS